MSRPAARRPRRWRDRLTGADSRDADVLHGAGVGIVAAGAIRALELEAAAIVLVADADDALAVEVGAVRGRAGADEVARALDAEGPRRARIQIVAGIADSLAVTDAQPPHWS